MVSDKKHKYEQGNNNNDDGEKSKNVGGTTPDYTLFKNAPIYRANSCFVDTTIVTLMACVLPGIHSAMLDKPIDNFSVTNDPDWGSIVDSVHNSIRKIRDYEPRKWSMIIKTHSQGLQRTSEYIRQELTRIQKFLNGEAVIHSRTLDTLRMLFTRFDHIYYMKDVKQYDDDRYGDSSLSGHREWQRTQNEPLDVLMLLDRVFKFPRNDIKLKVGKMPSSSRTEYHPWMFPMISWDPKTQPQISVQEYLSNDDTYTFINANCMFISIRRENLNGKKKTTPVVPEETIFLKKGALHLCAILMHKGKTIRSGHYHAFIRTPEKMQYKNKRNKRYLWFHYDDMERNQPYRLIGTYKNLLAGENEELVLQTSAFLVYTQAV